MQWWYVTPVVPVQWRCAQTSVFIIPCSVGWLMSRPEQRIMGCATRTWLKASMRHVMSFATW